MVSDAANIELMPNRSVKKKNPMKNDPTNIGKPIGKGEYGEEKKFFEMTGSIANATPKTAKPNMTSSGKRRPLPKIVGGSQ